MSEYTEYDTIVIGGGVSGLATALRRRSRGDKVLLLEKNEWLGGKLDVKEWNGYKWDKGPSLFTLPHLVDELFELFGKKSIDYFKYKEHHENTRYIFNDGARFTLHGKRKERKKELLQYFSDQEVERVESYIQDISKTYRAIGDLFTDRPRMALKHVFHPDFIRQYPKIFSGKMLRSLNGYNERTLRNPQLVQLFNRFGTYNGSNPYKMSGLYSMIPHLELNIGTFFPEGGMRAIIESLEKLAREEGVEISLNEDAVTADLKSSGYLVQTSTGTLSTKHLVCSIDHVNFYRKVLRDNHLFKKFVTEERSSSGLIFYWAVNHHFEEIGLHNIIFSANYRQEFQQIFEHGSLPDDPTIYIHNSSAVERTHAPEGCQNWFVMINTPAGIEPSPTERARLKMQIVEKVKATLGFDISDHIVHEDYWSMARLEMITGSYKGALYGGDSNSKWATFKRHGNTSKKYKHLYFTGGSVHPGGGIPLVLKSAKIVDQLIEDNG